MPIGVLTTSQWTFLEIVQRLRMECGIAGTGPTTVVGQTGEMLRLVNWASAAWFQIQSLHKDWLFKRHSTSFPTVNAQATYTPNECNVDPGTFSRWVRDSFRCSVTATGLSSEVPMEWMPYEWWRDTYQLGTMRTVYTRPHQMTITPAKAIGLGPVPSAAYTIIGDYYTSPIRLVNDDDIPELPQDHDAMLIVYRAMMDYGTNQSAPEVYGFAKQQFDVLYSVLSHDQLPELQFNGGFC